MNSEAAIASWGAVFTWLRAQRAVYLRSRERPIVVAELWGEGIHILGRSFQVQSPWLGSSEGGFFKFKGRPVVFAELKGAICILGRHFHLVGSSEGGIFSGLEGALLWFRNTGATFTSWGAVSRFRILGWEAQRAVFSGL